MTINTRLICYDTNFIKESIGNVVYNDYVINYHDDQQTCIDYVQSISKSEAIFLITSIDYAIDILPIIHHMRQLDSVFIFSNEDDFSKYEYLFETYSKLIGIFNQLSNMFRSIQANIDLAIKQTESFQFYERKQKSTRDLSKEAGSFLWLRVFKDVVLNLPHDEQSKQEMIDKLKEYYHNNNRQLKLIERFTREYSSKDALRWYSGQPFLYKQLNRALRTEDIELLYTFRYFLSDICKNLAHEYETIKESFDNTITVYRGVQLSKDEIKKLTNNIGKLISTNGFLSTSCVRNVALAFVGKSTDNEESVLFEIECDLGNNDGIIMGSIRHFSLHPEEEEILFDLDAAFELVSVIPDESLNILIVKMKLTNEGVTIAREHLEEHRKYMSTSGVVLVFGRLLAEIGEYDRCQKYFDCLLKNPNGENISFIYYYIGVAHFYKGDYEEAQTNYEKAYDLMINGVPPLRKASSYVLNDLGSLCYLRGQYDKALDYHMRSLKIREDYSDFLMVATSLGNIGNTYRSKGEYHRALEYLLRCLCLREQYLPAEHKETAITLSNISLLFSDMNKLDVALEYQQKSLKMSEKCLPEQHETIALCLYRMGLILINQAKYDDALDYLIRALNIRENVFPNGHIKISNTMSNIGYVYYSKKNYILALDYLKKSLEMREMLFSDITDSGLLNILTYFGLTYTKLHDYDNALIYHMRALRLSETLFHAGHGEMTDCLTNVGIVYRQMKNFPNAFEYFEKALKNEEMNTTKPNQLKIARTYDNMGICLCYQDDDRKGLEYRLKAVRIIEHLFPCKQYGEWIDSIGTIFFDYEMYDEALECYLISLNIKIQCFPDNSIEIGESFIHIGDVYIEKDKIEVNHDTDQYKTKAQFYYENALAIYQEWKHPCTAEVRNKISTLHAQGSEAEKHNKETIENDVV